MKIYISADMEGISGISSGSFVNTKGDEYQRGRKFMTQEVNAAIEGAFAAGATEVVVNDAHGGMKNILIEDLDTRATLISNYPKQNLMMCGLDNTFDCAIFIGYHTKVGSKGILSHTISGGLFNKIVLNGKEYGEYGINAATAGYYNVPVVLVSGDNYLKEEVLDINSSVTCVTTKQALSQVSACLRNPKSVCEEIKESVQSSIKNSNLVKTVNLGSIKAEIDFKLPVYADIAEMMPGIERTGDHSISFEAKNIIECTKYLSTLFNASCVMSIGLY